MSSDTEAFHMLPTPEQNSKALTAAAQQSRLFLIQRALSESYSKDSQTEITPSTPMGTPSRSRPRLMLASNQTSPRPSHTSLTDMALTTNVGSNPALESAKLSNNANPFSISEVLERDNYTSLSLRPLLDSQQIRTMVSILAPPVLPLLVAKMPLHNRSLQKAKNALTTRALTHSFPPPVGTSSFYLSQPECYQPPSLQQYTLRCHKLSAFPPLEPISCMTGSWKPLPKRRTSKDSCKKPVATTMSPGNSLFIEATRISPDYSKTTDRNSGSSSGHC